MVAQFVSIYFLSLCQVVYCKHTCKHWYTETAKGAYIWLCTSDNLYTSRTTGAEFKCITINMMAISTFSQVVYCKHSCKHWYTETAKAKGAYIYMICFNYVHHQINYIHHELCITWWQYISAFSRVVYCKHSCKCKHW